MCGPDKYLKKKYQSLNVSFTPDFHTLNFYTISNFICNIERTQLLNSLTDSLGKLNYTKVIKMPGRAEWLLVAGDYEYRNRKVIAN